MTITGGFVCGDGVLLFADTEWTWTTLKIQRAKHWRSHTPEMRFAAAAAGNENSIQVVVQHLMVGLNALQEKRNELLQQDVYVALETILGSFYEKHVYRVPGGDANELALMVAVATPREPPVLYRTSGTSVSVCDSYHYIGAGAEMAAYLTSKMWRDAVPYAAAQYLAAYIPWEVKNHVIYCGGDSVIYSLGIDGTMRYLASADVRDFEEHFANIEKSVSNVRLRTADLEASDETFAEIMREFCEEITELRKIRLEKLKGELKINVIREKWPRIHNMDG